MYVVGLNLTGEGQGGGGSEGRRWKKGILLIGFNAEHFNVVNIVAIAVLLHDLSRKHQLGGGGWGCKEG